MGLQVIFFGEETQEDCRNIYEIQIPWWAWNTYFLPHLPPPSPQRPAITIASLGNGLQDIDDKDFVRFLWRRIGGFLDILKECTFRRLWYTNGHSSNIDPLYENYQELLLCDWECLQLYNNNFN